jgi:hypothetical protein
MTHFYSTPANKIWLNIGASLFAWLFLSVWIPNQAIAQCGTISSANCPDVVVGIPYNLTFTGNEGGLLANNASNNQTGFTMVLPHSAPRASDDAPASYNPPSQPIQAYERAKLNITGGNLVMTANKGRAGLAQNNQVNSLGVGLQSDNQSFVIQTTLQNPTFAAGQRQAGLWYGLDEDNYVRLVVKEPSNATAHIVFRIERNGVSAVGTDSLRSVNLGIINTQNIQLKLLVNNTGTTKTVKAFYKIGNNTEVEIGQFTQNFGTGITLSDGITTGVSFAGVFASHGTSAFNAGNPMLAAFTEFKVAREIFFSSNSVSQTLQQDNSTTFSLDIATSDNSTPIVSLSADAGGSVPTWLTFAATHNTADPNVTFTIDATGLSLGLHTATVTATANGYSAGTFSVSLNVVDNARPRVNGTSVGDGQTDVPRNVSISTTSLYLPVAALDNTTVNNTTVRIETVAGSANIPSQVNSTGGGDAITITPSILLDANTQYRLLITNGVADLEGRLMTPYAITFTTGTSTGNAGGLAGVQFTKVNLGAQAEGSFTTLVIGPDGKLYGAMIDGKIKRFTINPTTGALSNPEMLTPFGATPRVLIGLTFDPAATAGNLIAWATYEKTYIHESDYDTQTAPNWDGVIARLTGANLQNVENIVENLPRSVKDHLTNSLVFGPDGALYISQGANSAMGRADLSWGNREESLLSAAILRLDVNNLGTLPINVLTPDGGGIYNPFAANAPLTIYATGVRNAYDLVWHSNGELYAPTNGSAAGGRTPTSNPTHPTYIAPNPNIFYNGAANIPTLIDVQPTQNDWLFRVRSGGYYGHPNPFRAEYIMNRGDADVDDSGYNGLAPDPNYRGAAFNFGVNKSPNGVIEYKSNSFGGLLKGKILVVRYSQNDDIIILEPGGANKDIINHYADATFGLSGFADPLDLIEDTENGNLYVAEFNGWNGGSTARITLLKPNTPPVAAGNISYSPARIIDNAVNNTTGTNRVITITNTGNANLSITNIVRSGTDNTQLTLSGLPAFPASVAPNATLTFNIAFAPTSIGLKTAYIDITSNDLETATVQVELRAYSTSPTGDREPSLQNVLNTYNIPVSVGDDDASTGIIHSADFAQAILGEELPIQKFQKAGAGNVTLEVLSVFGPTAQSPVCGFGWYNSGNAASIQELFTVPNTTGQSLNPIVNGTLTFDPGHNNAFGFYSNWPFFSNRHLYSQDYLNNFANAVPHHIRVYALKNTDGTVIPDAYIIATEEHINGFDFQDIVVIARNVKPYQGSSGVMAFDPTSKSVLVAQNAFADVSSNLTTSDLTPTGITLTAIDNATNGTPTWLNPVGQTWGGLFIHDSNAPNLNFRVNSTGLPIGAYQATITATSNAGFAAATFVVNLTVFNPNAPLADFRVNFQDQNSNPPTPWLVDYGQPYGLRTAANQGNGVYTYGWVTQSNLTTPLDLTAFGATRSAAATGENIINVTVMQMQAGGNQGAWQAVVPNGSYEITARVGDISTPAAPVRYVLNVEGNNFIDFEPINNVDEERIATFPVEITDGKLTLDAVGGSKTRIKSVIIKPFNKQLAFNDDTLSISIPYLGGTGNLNAILSANLGTPSNIALTKSGGSAWVTVPSATNLGAVNFGVNADGLTPGTYYATITATMPAYTSGKVVVKLNVVPRTLGFSPTTLDFTVSQGGTPTPQNATITASSGTPILTLTEVTHSAWVILPATAELGTLSFGINADGLSAGSYTAKVVVQAVGYTQDTLTINLTVNPIAFPNTWKYRINFQTAGLGLTASLRDLGYTHKDNGEPYGVRNDDGSGIGFGADVLTYGWIHPNTNAPEDNGANGENRTNFAGTYPIDLYTLNKLQVQNDEANWEIALPNGFYRIQVVSGDAPTGLVSISHHILHAEGVEIVNFNQIVNGNGVGGYSTPNPKVIEVKDGKLTIDAHGGINSKICYIWIQPLDEAQDNIPPVVNFAFEGVETAPYTYRNPTTVSIVATDEGGSGVATIEYQINGSAFKPYSSPLLMDFAGEYDITARVTDGNGNQVVTPAYRFSIVNPTPANNTTLMLENLNRYPDNETYLFSFVQKKQDLSGLLNGPNYLFPFPNNFNYNTDASVMRIHNRGTNNLVITGFVIADTVNFKIGKIGNTLVNLGAGSVPLTNLLPLNVTAGGFVDITLVFMARRPLGAPFPQRVQLFTSALQIISNDDANPSKTVELRGVYQESIEGVSELYAQEIIASGGFKTQTGFLDQNGNHTNPIADEIYSPYFTRANPAKKVYVRQVGAYHGKNKESIRRRNKGDTGNGNIILVHHERDFQTLLPRRSPDSTLLTEEYFPGTTQLGTNNPFAIRINTDDSDPERSADVLLDAFGNRYRGVRIWRAVDKNGSYIPHAFFASHDYLSMAANLDYNDNLYYLENIKPEIGTDFYSELIGGNGINGDPNQKQSELFFQQNIGSTQEITLNLRSLGELFPDNPNTSYVDANDPDIIISSMKIIGTDTDEFSATTPANFDWRLSPGEVTNLKVTFRPTTAGLKKAILVIYSNMQPLRVPLYGTATSPCYTITAVRRVKSAVPNTNPVTIAGQVWESDRPYRNPNSNAIWKEDNTTDTSTEILETDRDALYRSYLSTQTNLVGIGYQVPIANGTYLVRLHLAENNFYYEHERMNNILIENQLKEGGIDILAQVGRKTALVKDFQVTVTDGNLNINFVPSINRPAVSGFEVYSVVFNDPITLTVSNNTPATCGQENGSITVQANNASGGSAMYKLGFYGDYQAAPTFAGLAKGTYQIFAKENGGTTCETSVIVTVGEANNNITFNLQTTPESCDGSKDGTAALTNIDGGVAPYQVQWNLNPMQTTTAVTGLKAGNYTVTITDATRCSLTQSLKIGFCNGSNNTPTVANPIANISVFKNSSNAAINLSNVFADADNDYLSLSVSDNTNTALVTSSLLGNTLTLSFAPNSTGTAQITMRATDPGSLFAEDVFTVTVNELAITVIQNTRRVLKGKSGEMIVGVVVNNPATMNITGLTFRTNGTTDTEDIEKVKLFYSNTVNSPAAATQIGSDIDDPDDTFEFSGFTQALANGNNYFWLIYDIDEDADTGNVLDAELVSGIINGISNDIVNGNPAGNRLIDIADRMPGNLVDLDGVDDRIEIPNESQFDFTNAMTVETWVKIDAFTRTNQTIISKGNIWTIRRNGATSNKIAFVVRSTTAPTTNVPILSINDITFGEWHHVVGTFDGTTTRFYLNGVLQGTNTIALNSLSTNAEPLWIGNNSQDVTRQFDGQIDEVRVWSVARTQNQIRENMHLTLTGNETGLVGYWQFNETSGASVLDLVNNNDAALVNGTARVSATEPVGGGVAFRTNSIASTLVDYINTGLRITFGATHPNGEIVVSRLENLTPAGADPAPSDAKSPHYWVINNYGTTTGLSGMTLRFYLPGFLLEADPSKYTLYKRASNSTGIWANFPASTVNLTDNYVEFTGITGFSQAILAGSGVGLPVSLLNFEGNRLDEQTVKLTWETISEVNNQGFEIEKSSNATDYEKIGSVEGKGNSQVRQSYAFLDNEAMLSAYYRLKQIDFDGKVTHSKPIYIKGGAAKLRLFPNPVIGNAILESEASEELEKATNVVLQMTDSRGKMLLYRVGALSELMKAINAQLPQLSSGLYILRFQLNATVHTVKIVKN